MDDEALRMTFDVLDTDSNGIITSKEVQDVFKVFDIEENGEKIDKMVAKADVEGNGGIDFPQFKHIMKKCRQKINPQPRLLRVFQLIDSDNTGNIDVEKLKEFMRKIGHDVTEQEVNDMIVVADEDGDGMVNFHEFLKMVQ